LIRSILAGITLTPSTRSAILAISVSRRQLGEAAQAESRVPLTVDQPKVMVTSRHCSAPLEAHEFDVELFEALAGFGQEFG
jgi:hypothetical protein